MRDGSTTPRDESTNARDGSASPREAALDRLLSLQKPEESDAEFARRVGLAPQVLSNYKNRHHGLSLKSALAVHQHAGVSLDWLLAGHGSPRLSRNGDGAPFEEGTRYVFDRLLRSVTRMADAMEKAGTLEEGEAEQLRSTLREHVVVSNGGPPDG